ncbi:MAG: hypothetical protein WAX44_00670 [Minisyncoccia bacterium]
MPISNLTHREEYLRKKRKQRQIKLGLSVLLVIIFISAFSYISHRSEFRISKIKLSGGVLVTEEEVGKKSKEYLEGSYLWLFPKDNFFWYSKTGLNNHLKESFKRIEEIDISLTGFKTLIVSIRERKPYAIWCNTVPGRDNATIEGVISEVASLENCYFIDQNSTIFAMAPNFSGDAYFKYYGIISGESILGKEYMASSTLFRDINIFVSKIKELSLNPLYIVGNDNGEFTLTLSGGTEIYFDTAESLTKVYDNLEALLKTPDLNLTNDGDLPVQYIDLRYGNKLFYKLKGE